MNYLATLVTGLLATCVVGVEAKLPAEALSFWAYDNPQNNTFASDVDRNGNIVGSYIGPQSLGRGFIRSPNGNYEDLVNDLDGAVSTAAKGVNTGFIVGTSSVAGFSRAWIYDRTARKFSWIEIPGADDSYGVAINERGTIVGNFLVRGDSYEKNKSRGFILRNGKLEILTTQGNKTTRIISLNNKDRIGFYTIEKHSAPTYYILEPDGTRTLLTAKLEGEYIAPDALGDNGDYAGTCTDFISAGCAFKAKTGEAYYTRDEFCPYYNFEFTSMKFGAVVGNCYQDGLFKGFITTKKHLYAEPY